MISRTFICSTSSRSLRHPEPEIIYLVGAICRSGASAKPDSAEGVVRVFNLTIGGGFSIDGYSDSTLGESNLDQVPVIIANPVELKTTEDCADIILYNCVIVGG